MDTIAVTESTKMVAEYGILTVCAGVVILLVVAMFLTIQKQNKQLLKRLLDGDKSSRNSSEQKSVENHLDIRHKIDMQVHVLLQKLLSDTKADKVFIVEFHNGEYNLGGLPLAKMTETFEVARPYIQSSMNSIKGLSTSLFPTLMKNLFSYGKFVVNDIKNIETIAPALYQTFKPQGINAFYFHAIYDLQSRIIGFLGVCYSDEANYDLNDDDVKGPIKIVAIKLDGLLTIVFEGDGPCANGDDKK